MRLVFRIFFYPVVFVFLGACSHNEIHSKSDSLNRKKLKTFQSENVYSRIHLVSTKGLTESNKNFNKQKDIFFPPKSLPDQVQDTTLKNKNDILVLPSEFNDKVIKWIKHYQTKGRQAMKINLSLSSKYTPKMKEIFKSYGLPEDLVYLVMIESGFRSNARSRSKAVGYWQFIHSTGRLYGLKKNYYMDERRDFIRSTRAAAQYLKALYSLFGSWYLAIASYNAGENRIKNLVMKYYTRDFWQLAKTRLMPSETRNYVPKFLAVRYIAKQPIKYGFYNVIYQQPLRFKEVTLKNRAVKFKRLAKTLGVPDKELYELNPSYTRGIIPRKKLNIVRLPTHVDAKKIIALVKNSKTGKRKITKTSKTRKISRKNRKKKTFKKTRKVVKLKKSKSKRRKTAGVFSKKPKYAKNKLISKKKKTHIVQRGESLYTIARHYKTSISALARANNMKYHSLLITGRKLVIP